MYEHLRHQLNGSPLIKKSKKIQMEKGKAKFKTLVKCRKQITIRQIAKNSLCNVLQIIYKY